MALPEPQFPQAGAGQRGTSRQQHLHGFLTAGFFGVRTESSVLPLGGELNGVILLETQQIRAGDPQQQAIARFKAPVCQGGQQPLSTALQLQHVHVETALQPTVQQ